MISEYYSRDIRIRILRTLLFLLPERIR